MIHLYLIVLFLILPHALAYQQTSYADTLDEECRAESDEWEGDLQKVNGPLIPCDTLSYEWFECEDVTQLVVDNTTRVS
jgi:hypothetical protein